MILKRFWETARTASVVVLGVLLFVAGCGEGEKEEVVVDYSDPAVRGADPEYQALLEKRNEAQKAIAVKRAPLVARMAEIAKENGNDEEKLKTLAEWNDLRDKVMKLNEEYEAARKETMALIRRQIMTKKTVSK